MNKKLIDIIGTLLLFTGMFLAFLPHTLHAKVGLGKNTSHIKHIIYGISLVIVALGILVYNNKALKIRKV